MEQMLDARESETAAIKCSGCGAEMTYDIQSGNLKCNHCGAEQKIEADDSVWRRQLTDEIMKDKGNWSDARVHRCDGCGAKEVLERKNINIRCAFCGSTSIVSTDELCGIKPDCIIPFKIDPTNSQTIFLKWIKSRIWAPRSFKTADIRERMNSLYIPSWAFTSQVFSTYRGTLGRQVQTTRRGPNGQMMTTYKTVYFNVSGQMNKHYTDFLVQSSDRISPINFNKLKPFDVKEKKPYRTEFIAGIITEHYSRSLEACFSDFSNHIRSDLRRDIMRRHNADTVSKLDIKLDFPTREFNYILLPLYIANYKYKTKTYNFFVNGVTGKIVGKYPVSKLKITLLILGIAVVSIIGIAAYLWL